MDTVKAFTGKGKYIFVSYAHSDSEQVLKVIQFLQKNYNVWFDEGIKWSSHQSWSENIAERIEQSSLLIFMVSNKSLNSRDCLNEISFADKKGISFVNVLIEQVDLPSAFDMNYSRYQMCKLYEYSSYDLFLSDLEQKLPEIVELRINPQFHYETVTAKTIEEYDEYVKNGYCNIEIPVEMKKEIYELMKEKSSLSNNYMATYIKCLYKFVEGVDEPDLYFKLSKKLVEDNFAKGYNLLGNAFFKGIGTNKSFNDAYHNYNVSAEMGYAIAQRNLALCYYYGYGVEKSPKQMAYWLKEAAEKGDAESQYLLAQCYETGFGVSQSNSAAISWYLKATTQGHKKAEIKINMYHI